ARRGVLAGPQGAHPGRPRARRIPVRAGQALPPPAPERGRGGGGGDVSWKEIFEFASFVVTVVALPFPVVVFAIVQREERDHEEEEAYQHLSDGCTGVLTIVRAASDLLWR